MPTLWSEGPVLFTGNANPALAADVAAHLGIPLGKAIVGRFSDGEVNVEILENVRGKDAFVIQSTCAPTNDHLMELMILVDALRRASAGRITAVVPYFGYARQDRRVRSSRVAISAKVVANMLQVAGVDRVLTMDLHADQIQGFFRSCLLMDDMVDTAGTLCRAAEALKKHGAVRVSAYCTHPVLSGKAIERITESPLDELVVTDTIPLTEEGRACGKIRVLGCGQLIGETILRINRSDSVSMLFME